MGRLEQDVCREGEQLAPASVGTGMPGELVEMQVQGHFLDWGVWGGATESACFVSTQAVVTQVVP